jgi:predicted RNA-binding Zn-ribbon protein involved in translation (DUF1610 family)
VADLRGRAAAVLALVTGDEPLPCPRCGAWIVLSWEGVQWDAAAKRKAGWDLAAVRKTAFYSCPECRGRIDGGDFKPRAAFFKQWRNGFWRGANRCHTPGAARGMLVAAARHNQCCRLIER